MGIKYFDGKKYKRWENLFPFKDNLPQDKSVNIPKVYDKLLDKKSRYIFEKRLLASIIDDERYIEDIIREGTYIQQVKRLFQSENYIYGAGRRLDFAMWLFYGVTWKGIIDQKKTSDYEGIKIKRLEEYCISNDAVVLVTLKEGTKEVMDKLLEKGIKAENIIILNDVIKEVHENTYFDDEIFCQKRQDVKGVFIDAGCYDGMDTIKAKAYFPNIDKVVSFEPDPENYEKCKKNLNKQENVELYNKGLSDHQGEEYIVTDGVASHIASEGSNRIVVDSIDDIFRSEKVGFIKMDIEGSEYDALNGAEAIIKKYTPCMAISVYHKKSDIWRIPVKILEIEDSYSFYLRHYSTSWGDTVLYAVDAAI